MTLGGGLLWTSLDTREIDRRFNFQILYGVGVRLLPRRRPGPREIFALQGETARAIAGEIGIAVTSEEERRLASVQAIDPQAWDAYFRGRYHLEESAQAPVSVAVEAVLST